MAILESLYFGSVTQIAFQFQNKKPHVLYQNRISITVMENGIIVSANLFFSIHMLLKDKNSPGHHNINV